MYVCVYVRMSVSMYACMHACPCVHTYVCIHMYTCARVRIRTHVPMYIHMHLTIHVFLDSLLCAHSFVCWFVLCLADFVKLLNCDSYLHTFRLLIYASETVYTHIHTARQHRHKPSAAPPKLSTRPMQKRSTIQCRS